MSGLPMAERLEANALLISLLEEGDHTFSAKDASRLIELIPCEAKGGRVTFSSKFTKTGSRHAGYAAGVGQINAEDKDSKQVKEFNLNGFVVWRIGGYKVTHIPGMISVTHMMTSEMTDQHECTIEYSKLSRRPVGIFQYEPRIFSLPLLPFISLSVPKKLLWKRPAEQLAIPSA